jgi:glycosyltransferase involved in cell wall biosynthesis
MKIVFVTSVSRKINHLSFDNEPLGGTHHAMFNLAFELSNRHDVKIFCNCQGYEGKYNNIEYIQLNKIISYCKQNDIDILICVASETILKTNIKAKKIILWLHNDYSIYWNNELSDISYKIAEIISFKPDKIVCVSNWHKEIIKQTFKIPDNHIHVIYNGIDLTLFKNVSLNNKLPRIIYTNAPDRGLEILLEIFPKVKEKYSNFELHIYSSFLTWGKDDFDLLTLENEIIQDYKNIDGIFINKPLPLKKLIDEMSKSYLFVYPSCASDITYFNSETFCMSVLEAQACYLPVITFNRGALSEVIIQDRTGILIDENNSNLKEKLFFEICNLIDNKKLYLEFSKNTREWIKNFDIKKISKEWELLFNDLLNNKNINKPDKVYFQSKYDKPYVSIIIPTYNRENNLKYCLNSLTKQTFKNFEVIVSDDGSTDNTKEIVNSFRDKLNIRYIYLGKNRGFRAARTRNFGLKRSRGEIIIFLDSDIVVPSNYIEEHLKAHEKYDEVIVNSFVYRMKYYFDEDLGVEPKIFVEKHRDKLNDDIKYEFNVFDREPIEEGYYLDSNSMSIKAKHIINEGFDSSFVGWGHEDTELGYRFIQKGFKFLFIKNNCESYHIYHKISENKEEETKVNWKRLTKKYMLKKWYDPLPRIFILGNAIINENKNSKTILECLFELKRGDKFSFSQPEVEIEVENSIIKEIKLR